MKMNIKFFWILSFLFFELNSFTSGTVITNVFCTLQMKLFYCVHLAVQTDDLEISRLISHLSNLLKVFDETIREKRSNSVLKFLNCNLVRVFFAEVLKKLSQTNSHLSTLAVIMLMKTLRKKIIQQ